MTGRTEIRVREIRRRTRRYRRRRENCELFSLTVFGLFLLAGIGVLFRSVQTSGVASVADGYGGVPPQAGAGAYVLVGIVAFLFGVSVPVPRLRLKNKSTNRTGSTEESEDERK